MSFFARRAASPEPIGYSIIDEQSVIRGEITTKGTIRVDGRLEGRMQRADSILIGSGGVIVGDIEAREVCVGGTIEGNVIAIGRVEIEASATVRGDIKTAALLLHEGGTIHGHVAVGNRQAEPGEAPRLEIARSRSTPSALGG